MEKNVEIEDLKKQIAKMGDWAREDNARDFRVIINYLFYSVLLV